MKRKTSPLLVVVMKCDECGKELMDRRKYPNVYSSVSVQRLPAVWIKPTVRPIFLCYECYEKLKKRIR